MFSEAAGVPWEAKKWTALVKNGVWEVQTALDIQRGSLGGQAPAVGATATGTAPAAPPPLPAAARSPPQLPTTTAPPPMPSRGGAVAPVPNARNLRRGKGLLPSSGSSTARESTAPQDDEGEASSAATAAPPPAPPPLRSPPKRPVLPGSPPPELPATVFSRLFPASLEPPLRPRGSLHPQG